MSVAQSNYNYPLYVPIMWHFHFIHLKLINLFHSSQHQNVNLPVRLQLAPAVESERSAITTNCFQLGLTCSNLHLPHEISL